MGVHVDIKVSGISEIHFFEVRVLNLTSRTLSLLFYPLYVSRFNRVVMQVIDELDK